MRIAAAQGHPVWLDAEATTAKVVSAVEQAASDGVELLAFPEAFLPGYPFWAILGGVDRLNEPRHAAAYGSYLDASITIEGPQIRLICQASSDLGVFVYLGIAERSGGSVYATLVAIDPTRGVIGTHRKLMPTHGERVIWAPGDGAGLRTHDVHGLQVGGLNCWENWMPLARYSL